MKFDNHLYTVIMAGGSGTRFWPLSRHLYPKQLLKIMGEETMIQQTMRRALRCTPPDRVLISTTPAQADSIRVQLGEWKLTVHREDDPLHLETFGQLLPIEHLAAAAVGWREAIHTVQRVTVRVEGPGMLAPRAGMVLDRDLR